MAKMAAEQVAAKLNQSISMGGAVPSGIGGGAHAGLGLVSSEEWAIPNRVVGLGRWNSCFLTAVFGQRR